MKKVLIISLVLLGITLLFLGVYNFIFKKNTPKNIQPIVETPTVLKKELIEKKTEKIKALSEQAIIGPIFDKKSETIIYYSAQDGAVWSVGSDGVGKKQISDAKLTGLRSVFWLVAGNKVLTEFEKNGQKTFYYYNHREKTGKALKSNIDSVAWDYTGAKILYKHYDPNSGKRTLNVSNPDGSEWKSLTEINYKNIIIAPIPLSSKVSYWNYPNAFEETRFQEISIMGGQPQVILSGRFGADFLWSPDGKQALVSSLTNKNGRMVTLGLVKSNGEYTELNIPTLISKCVWSPDGKTIYYALPGGVPDGSIMPNDYQEKKFMTEDTFWKINIETGRKERVVETSDIIEKYDSSNLFLSATQDALYFINRIDGKLYRIGL